MSEGMTQPPRTTGPERRRVFPYLERAAERDTLGTMKVRSSHFRVVDGNEHPST